MIDTNSNQARFLELLSSVNRNGAKELCEWLKKTDFFTAPASTKFHLSEEGGLCEHSLHVYDRLCKEVEDLDVVPGRDTVILISLLHDLCKTNFYSVDYRNAKNESGVWIKVPYYTIKDQYPMGHGEKSVFLIERFVRLTEEEAIAVRWHMGGFDDAVRGGSFTAGNAFNMYPLALALHVADLKASYYDEVKE